LNIKAVERLFNRIVDDIYLAAKSGKCYWELVPANCFYNQETDELLYFDQEYYTEGADPDIAVARAVGGLKYSEVFARNPKMQELYQQLLEQYKLQNNRDMINELLKLGTYIGVFGQAHRLMQDLSRKNAEAINESKKLAD
jgi:hypothetical protein